MLLDALNSSISTSVLYERIAMLVPALVLFRINSTRSQLEPAAMAGSDTGVNESWLLINHGHVHDKWAHWGSGKWLVALAVFHHVPMRNVLLPFKWLLQKEFRGCLCLARLYNLVCLPDFVGIVEGKWGPSFYAFLLNLIYLMIYGNIYPPRSF